MKILFTADIHIGRRSSRLPAGADGSRHSASAAWGRVVDLAVAERVDLVLVSGDLVDEANRFLEAIGPLERGLRRLFEAGVEVVVVAGNHDWDVLPALVDSIGGERLRLLGRQGRWERHTVERGGERLHLDGWSFSRARWMESPLVGYAPVMDRAPTLALVHGDLDQPGSVYGPLTTAELRRHPDVLFLLGHVHMPRFVEEPGGARFVYPGSPQALDPGEPGAHGPWLLETAGGVVSGRQLPLSTVRYDALECGVGGIERPEDADGRLADALRAGLAGIGPDTGLLEVVRYRVRITGATDFPREVGDRLTEYAREVDMPAGALSGSVESIAFAMSPVHDLDALAEGVGAPAVLAKLVRDGASPELAAALHRVVEEIRSARRFVDVSTGADDAEALASLAAEEAIRAASVLIDELLRQKAGT